MRGREGKRGRGEGRGERGEGRGERGEGRGERGRCDKGVRGEGVRGARDDRGGER